MLIDKGVSEGEVVTIKMSTGEELLATYVESTPNGHKVKRPMVLSVSQKGIGMMPYIFTVHPDKEIVFNSATIMALVPTEKDFANQYLQSTTGIALAGV